MATWVRRYLSFGSFVGVALAAFGATSLLTAAITLVFGTELVYGSVPVEARLRTAQQHDLQRTQDAIRGATFLICGLGFWLGHRLARKRFGAGDHVPARRTDALVGATAYALVAIVLLPIGVSQALGFWLLPPFPGGYRGGVGQALAGGLVALAVWVLYLRLLLGDLARERR